jgi:hypothetical protein
MLSVATVHKAWVATLPQAPVTSLVDLDVATLSLVLSSHGSQPAS